MQVTMLGTSSGTPTRSRNVSAAAVNLEGKRDWVLVDCGEGTQHRLLRAPLSLLKLKAICITHMHGDHCYGLPGLLASAQLSGRTDPLVLIGSADLKSYIDAMQTYAELGLEYPLKFVDVESMDAGIEQTGLMITRTALSHRIPSYAYRFDECAIERRLDVERLKAEGIPAGPFWYQLQKGEEVTLDDGRVLDGQHYSSPSREPRVVIVAGDNDTPQLLEKACGGADLLVHEATYTEEVAAKVGPEPQHSTAQRVAEFAHRVRLPNLLLTHFSPRYQDNPRRDSDTGEVKGLSVEDLRNEAEAVYSGQLFMAKDLERYTLSRDKKIGRESLR